MNREVIRVGTRGSILARTQTAWVVEQVRLHHPHLRVETVIIRTAGDQRAALPAPGPLAKGLFTKEIEEALGRDAIDLAVHSLKDLPTSAPPGLMLGAVPPREDPRDVLVGCTLEQLADAAAGRRVGTSSLRRQAHLRRAFPGCTVVDLRGNLDTRLAKVRAGAVDGAVLAGAGLLRLGHAASVAAWLPPELMLPAPGQGALAVQIRAADAWLRDLLRPIHCIATWQCVTAERAFMQALGGGCRLPVAALGEVCAGRLRLHGRVLGLDGARCVEGRLEGRPEEADALGRKLADMLLGRGAGDLLRNLAATCTEDGSDA